jgi:hypothetical protein
MSNVGCQAVFAVFWGGRGYVPGRFSAPNLEKFAYFLGI